MRFRSYESSEIKPIFEEMLERTRPAVVLVPTPSFPIHIYGPVIAGANVIGITMNEGDETLLRNIAHMCENLVPRPKILILNYPNNPTTRTVEIDFFKEIVKLGGDVGCFVPSCVERKLKQKLRIS